MLSLTGKPHLQHQQLGQCQPIQKQKHGKLSLITITFMQWYMNPYYMKLYNNKITNLITFTDLTDNFACCWIDNWECFPTLWINKLSINEELNKHKIECQQKIKSFDKIMLINIYTLVNLISGAMVSRDVLTVTSWRAERIVFNSSVPISTSLYNCNLRAGRQYKQAQSRASRRVVLSWHIAGWLVWKSWSIQFQTNPFTLAINGYISEDFNCCT